MNTNTENKSGLFTKLLKGFCVTTFPVITSICVGPYFARDVYKVAQAYRLCNKVRDNILGPKANKQKLFNYLP